jgi:protein phosphatase
MGATVVVAYVRAGRAYIAHLGDSRAYRLRPGGNLQRLTHDHSVVGMLLDDGEITPSEAADHPARGVISRYMGMEQAVDPDLCCVRLVADDRLLLCSDGLPLMVPDSEIQVILSREQNPEAACRALVGAANSAGGKDNVTALIVIWDGRGASSR